MNSSMVGHPRHVPKALAQGVDIICAQGGEGGGHTGDTPFSILIPACVDLCKNATSPLTGQPVIVVAAGGIADGRGLAAALSYGAAGVWVGTRFVASEEAGAPPKHKQELLSAGYDDTVRTLLYSGRPMSVRKTPYVAEWYTIPSCRLWHETAYPDVPTGNRSGRGRSPSSHHRGRSLMKLNSNGTRRGLWKGECVCFFFSPVSTGANLTFFSRAHGQGGWFHQRHKARERHVSSMGTTLKSTAYLLEPTHSVDELVNTAVTNLTSATSLIVSKSKL